MAQATREISLAYGGSTIGGSSTKYHLTGAYRLELDNAQGALEVDVLVTAESVADFVAFEQIWRDVRVTATFTYLGSTLVSWNHSSGSGGVNTRASCSIPGTEEADAGLSRLYRVRIEADLIPNQTGQSGIRDHMAVITTPEYGAQRSAVISGVYIGSDLTTAVDAFCEIVRARNSISTWHLTNQDNEEDRDAKLVRWTRSYTEHFSGLRDHAAAVVVPESEQADVTVAGKYRGASYTSDVDTFAAAVKSRHSIGAWTLVSEQKDEDRQAQITTFSRKYAQTFSGIRDHSVIKSQTESEQKRVVISGVYTGSDLANDVDAYCATVLSRHSITASDLLRDDVEEDRDANVVRWTREYLEIIFDQSSGGRDHAAISNATLTIGREYVGEGDYADPSAGPVTRPVDVIATYSASIRSSVASDLDALYQGTIRPWVVSKMTELLAGQGGMALVAEAPVLDYYSWRISATLKARAPSAGGLLGATYNRQVRIETGKRVVPIWGGSAYSGTVQQGPAKYTVRERRTRVRLASAGSLMEQIAKASSSGGGGVAPNGQPLNSGPIIVGGQGLLAVGQGTGYGSINIVYGTSNRPQQGPAQTAQSPAPIAIDAPPPNGAEILLEFDESPTRLGLPGYTLDVVAETSMVETQFYSEAGPASQQTTVRP